MWERKQGRNYTAHRTIQDLIIECEEKYGNRYDFSNTKYNGVKNKINVFDKEKGNFIVLTPDTLLHKNYKNKTRLNKENFIREARKVHGDKYDYSITEYINCRTKIKFICPHHGIVEQFPNNHIKYGCRFCSYKKVSDTQRKTFEAFLEQANKIHGNKYDYSKADYINSSTKICIICPEHGEFWQTPSKHLYRQGCPKCKRSHLENEISMFLEEKNIHYIEQYSPDFLKNGKGRQKIDFFLPDFNVGIECQGIQHFSDSIFNERSQTLKNIKRDITKKTKCDNNGIKIVYFTKKEYVKLARRFDIYDDSNLFCDKEKLLLSCDLAQG